MKGLQDECGLIARTLRRDAAVVSVKATAAAVRGYVTREHEPETSAKWTFVPRS